MAGWSNRIKHNGEYDTSNDVDNQQVTLIKLNSSGLILIPNPLGYDQNNITVTHKAIDPRSGEYDLSR